ncbi:MAG: cytochrome P450 [Planctomycetota bacterium]
MTTVPPTAPPGPTEPFAFDANADTLRYLTEGFERWGDVWSIPPGGGADSATKGGGLPIWVLNDPEAIHHVLTKRQPDYGKGVGFERVKMLLGDGLIVSDGEHWRKRRQMLQPAFTRGAVGRMTGILDAAIDARAEVWERAASSGEPLDVSDEANRLGLRIILRAIFGPDLDELDAREGGNPFDLVVDTHTRDLMFAMRFRQLWPVVGEKVEERRARGPEAEPSDFLGAYLAARDKDGAGLDREGIVDEIMTLLVAGHETSAATIAWVWSLLSRHPEIQAAVREEALATDGRVPPGPAAPKALDLTHRVVHETLRHYPPVWMFTRRALVDDELCGYPVPAGTQILLSPFLLHRHPDHWEDPERFDPGRFNAAGTAPVRGAYIPFSSGPRRCAGDHFAIATVVRHLAWTASRYHLRPSDQGAPPRLDPGVNLRALEPIRLVVMRP